MHYDLITCIKRAMKIILFLLCLPAFAQEYPKILTLDLIMEKAIKNADSYQEIETLYQSSNLSEKIRGAPLEGEVFFKKSHASKKNDSLISIMPYEDENSQATLGARKLFQTGTALTASVAENSYQQKYGGVRPSTLDYKQSYLELSLSQQLLRDSFGRATRASLLSGKSETKIRELQITGSKEDWFLAITSHFYDAWFTKSRLAEAIASLERRKKLLRVALIKRARGTIEKADLLQIEGSVERSEIEVKGLTDALQSIWEDLIDVAKLPNDLKKIDPLTLPIDLDGIEVGATKNCQEETKSTMLLTAFESVNLYQSEVARTDNLKLPEAKLSLIAASSGIDSASSKARSEMIDRTNPSTTIAFELIFPWDNSLAKAKEAEAVANLNRMVAAKARIETEEESKKYQTCKTIALLLENRESYKKISAKFAERSKEEQIRYDLGRGTIFAVINAEDDLSNIQIIERENELKIKRSSWQLLRLANKIIPYITELEKR